MISFLSSREIYDIVHKARKECMTTRKNVLVAVALLLSGSLLFAQVAADPLDYFYDDLTIWETMGMVRNLPPVRPYPLPLVKTILESVMEKGDRTQREIARSHFDRLFGRTVSFGGKTGLALDTYNDYKQMDLAVSLDANFTFTDIVSASVSADGWAVNKLPDEELKPAWERSTKNIVKDNAKVGPFYILPSITSSISVGTDDTYLNAGLMRGSWGPIYENGIIVGQQAHAAGQFTFALNRPKWCFDFSLFALSATADDDVEDYYPDKYLSLHSFEYRPVDWFSISIFESVVYGDRLDLLYLLPLSPYMISQGNTGFHDNSYLGGTFTVRPLEGMKVDGTLIADDLSFNDIAKFNFDTKWRIAGQLGVSYAPRKSGLFTRIMLDYTMVTPYTYTHKEGDSLDVTAPNFQNYLHAGKNFGAALDPNSDRINLRIRLRPLEAVDVDLVGVLIRHGNVNEGMDDRRIREYVTSDGSYITDGSIRNASGTDSGHAFFYSTPFLTQDTIQYIWQTGFDVTCRPPVLKSGGYMVFRLGYRFEVNINPDVNRQVYTYDESLIDANGDRVSEELIDAAAADQLEDWKDKATGTVYNNYISVGFEYFF